MPVSLTEMVRKERAGRTLVLGNLFDSAIAPALPPNCEHTILRPTHRFFHPYRPKGVKRPPGTARNQRGIVFW